MNYNKNHDKKQELGTLFPILSNQSTFSIEMINPNTLPIWIMHSDHHQKEKALAFLQVLFGPSAEIRTQGLLNPIQARYQTSPHPETGAGLVVPDSSVIITHSILKCKPFFKFSFFSFGKMCIKPGAPKKRSRFYRIQVRNSPGRTWSVPPGKQGVPRRSWPPHAPAGTDRTAWPHHTQSLHTGS